MSRVTNQHKSMRFGMFRGKLARGLAPAIAGLCIAAGVLPMIAMAPPEPEAIPRRWQLEIESGPMRLASVDLPGVGTKAYFYLTYKVINNTGEDLLFAPAFELATEVGSRRSGLDVPVDVTKALIAQVQNPFIEDQISIIGQLLQGKENSKEGIVIWPADELDMDQLVVYGAGFSGETTTVEKPFGKDRVVLRKTYIVKYRISGDMSKMIGKEIERAEPGRWIMR